MNNIFEKYQFPSSQTKKILIPRSEKSSTTVSVQLKLELTEKTSEGQLKEKKV